MKYRPLLIVLLVLGSVSLVHWLSQRPSGPARLTWFELQQAPYAYRFAIIPKQPILIGIEGIEGQKGASLVISHDQAPEIYKRTIEKTSALLQQSAIMQLAPENPDKAFTQEALKRPSIHIRVAFSDKRHWAACYETGKAPKEIDALIQETKKLAQQIILEQAME